MIGILRMRVTNSDETRQGLPKQFRVVVHLAERVEDVGEQHHGEALLLVGGGAVDALPARAAVVLGAALVVQRQQLGHNIVTLKLFKSQHAIHFKFTNHEKYGLNKSLFLSDII